MPLSFPPTVGSSSLWGPIQHITPLGPDAVVVSTASHGGVCVSRAALERLPEPLRHTAYSGGWFEEDCDWAIPYLALSLDAAEASALPVIGPPADPCGELRERFAAHGPAALDEGDTLALILARCLRPSANPVGAADALMARFGGVGRIFGAPEPELARVVGAAAARELALLHGLLLRVLEHPLRQRTVLGGHEAVKTYLRARLTALPREVFQVLYLDKRNQLIADDRLGVGTVDHAPVYPREVVRRALEVSASAIVLAHNHPSGDPTPSRADIDMTRQVVEAARALAIAVHDHLLVAGDQVISFRAQGLM